MKKKFQNNWTEKHKIELCGLFGAIYYYGISNIVNSDKEKALFYFKKAKKISKEKNHKYIKKSNYIYIFKCRKYLFKNNKISLRKLNKTKEKLFRLFEDTKNEQMSVVELYNYYKLYKLVVYGNTKNKLISLLKRGKI